MLTLFRKIIGLSLAIPFFILIKLFSLFIGRQKAIEFWGPAFTFYVKVIANIFIIPKINSPLEFASFVSRMKRNIWLMKPLLSTSVAYEDKDKIVFNYINCPFCEPFFTLGLPEMGPYACQSDWEIAKDNADKWDFERSHQIGTGDKFCDHTYKRKTS